MTLLIEGGLEAFGEFASFPRLNDSLNDEKEEDMDAHEGPGTIGGGSADAVTPDLLFMVPSANGVDQMGITLLDGSFGGSMSCARLGLGGLISMFLPVEGCEACEILVTPATLPLE